MATLPGYGPIPHDGQSVDTVHTGEQHLGIRQALLVDSKLAASQVDILPGLEWIMFPFSRTPVGTTDVSLRDLRVLLSNN